MWVMGKRGLGYSKMHQESLMKDEGKVTELEDILYSSWGELDSMLLCSKHPKCVMRYQKVFRMGNMDVKANLIQSLTITLHQIKDIANTLKKWKRS